jgi:predicted N-acetyltransferase YhbS
MITYRTDATLSVEETIELLERSTLAARRPVDRPDVVAKMLEHADVLVTAWDGDRLVGLARSLTDYGYVAYLSDLAVDVAYQKRGIGRRLIELTRAELDPTAFLCLFAAPAAADYYGKVGFEPTDAGWLSFPPATGG